MTDTKDHDRRHPSPTDDTYGEDEKRSSLQDRRVALRRKADMEVYEMASSALSMATKASESIDRHIEQCADNYADMRSVGWWIIGLLVAGTGGIIGTLLYAINRLFEFILVNPHLFSNG